MKQFTHFFCSNEAIPAQIEYSYLVLAQIKQIVYSHITG